MASEETPENRERDYNKDYRLYGSLGIEIFTVSTLSLKPRRDTRKQIHHC
jgi:hypothetical protein